jgi:hypothetical protein
MLVAPAQAPAACAVPNAPAAIVRAAEPDAPAAPYQQRGTGTVQILVDLDEASRLTRATVSSATSAALSGPAIGAARRSVFRTAVRGCRPVPSRYTMVVTFNGPRSSAVSATDTSATVDGEGRASAPPDLAAAHIEFATRAATPAAAIAQNDALVDRYRAALRGLGIDPSSLVSGYYDVLPANAYAGQTGAGYFATHEVVLDATIVSAQSVFDAAAQCGATSGAVAYDVNDRKALYDAAVLAATRDAVLRTDRIVVERHVMRGPVLRSQPTYASPAPLEPVKLAPQMRAVIPPPHPVEMHVRLAVTYALSPE